MRVWGIDPSSKCGLAIWDTETNVASAHCEVIENSSEGDYYWFSEQMGRKLVNRVGEFGEPDLIVIEQGSESTQGTGVNGVIWCWNVIGSVVSLMGVYGKPIAIISPAGWRKPFFGRDYNPPQKPVTERVFENGVKITRQVIEKGKPKFKNDWKAAIIQKCADDGITLPNKASVAHNAGEAFGVAHSWSHSKVINPAHHKAFMALLQQRNERAPSGDLFAGAGA